MYLLFTKSNKWFSDLICSVTKEPVSHVAIYDPEEQVVYHSSFMGIEKLGFNKFVDMQERILFVPIEVDAWQVQKMYHEHKSAWYDFGAILFLGLSLMLRSYLRIPLPNSNLWQATGMFLCTEWYTKVKYNKELSMMTPWQLFKLINCEQQIIN